MELTSLSYADLIVQIAIFCALLLDYFVVRKKNLRLHGVLMTTAFVTSTILMVVVMVAPFIAESSEIFEDVLGMESLLFLSHHVLGLVAEILAAFIVFRWVLKTFDASSCKGKNLMRATVSTWLLSILLGIVIFILHFIE